MNQKKTAILNQFKSRYIAHRGLFNNNTNAPENTIAAFKNAVKAGFGIELDIQLSKDKQVVVAHDYSLKRICGIEKEISELSYQEICKYNILNSKEKIPLLTDVLSLVSGKVPLLIELKAEKNCKELCSLAAKILNSYSGVYCIESFSPFAVGWFKKHQPNVVRGQLADDFSGKKYFKSALKNWILTNMFFNAIYKPDFIAYNHEVGSKKCIKFWKKKLGCFLAAWTITSQEELDRAAKLFDILIFDSFMPV